VPSSEVSSSQKMVSQFLHLEISGKTGSMGATRFASEYSLAPKVLPLSRLPFCTLFPQTGHLYRMLGPESMGMIAISISNYSNLFHFR